jgi:hypothetical protein
MRTLLPEGHIVAYHPGLDQNAVVPATAMRELRVAGWITGDEHRSNQAQASQAGDAGDDVQGGGAAVPAGGPPTATGAKGGRGSEK